MVIRVELSTGEPISESPNFKLVEGSHSTKLTVRCDGSRVKITGNASRFHRIDNLFGLETIDDCINVYNQVLASFDLPHSLNALKLNTVRVRRATRSNW